MSKTLDEENIEKTTSNEIPEEKKETPSKENAEKSKYEWKTPEELIQEIEKLNKVKEDKHNFALKSEDEKKQALEELEKYRQKEAEEERLKKEAEGKYQELIQEAQSQSEAKKAEEELLKSELEKLRAENTAFIEDMEAKALAQIPEDKRETVNSIVSAYTGKEKIDKITELVTAFGGTVSFGGTPDVKKNKPGNEKQTLEAELQEKGLLSPSKSARLASLSK